MKRFCGILALTALLQACSPSAPADEGKVLMVSIEPQRNILEHLVDSTYTVKTLVAGSADPETFEPSTAARMDVDKAELFFATGVLPFEQRLGDVVDTSEGVELLFDTHGHSHDHGDHHDHSAADPHYWSSISGAKAIAKNMAKALSDADKTNANLYTQRLDAYMQHLDSLDAVLTSVLQPCSASVASAFAIWHPSLSYFARDYGLEQLAVGLEGKEMSAKGLGKAIDVAKEHGVKVFFFQKEYDSRQAETINEAIGSRLVTINPLAYDWEDQLILIANELAR